MRKPIDITGNTYGKWTVLELASSAVKGKSVMWWCRCGGCGRIKKVNGRNLRQGKTLSCSDCHCEDARALREWPRYQNLKDNVLRLRSEGLTYQAIADIVGCSAFHAGRIVRRQQKN